VISIERVRAAAERARPYVQRTPLLPVEGGSLLKLECLQPTGSFKVRGFFAAALALPEAGRSAGLMTVSAGNAALACAFVAHRLGVPCRVVMFDTVPPPKLEGVRRWGAEPILKTRPELLDWMRRRGWESEPESFIHPFASEEVMAGHGGVAIELLEQLPQLRRVLVPVGGGGLIGKAVARRAHRFSMRVLYWTPRRKSEAEEQEAGLVFGPLDQLLREADFISLHSPLNKETRHQIGARELRLMKKTAYIVNTARGPIIDEAALVRALTKKQIAGAGLDVFEHEPAVNPKLLKLARAGKVIVLPHMGSATIEGRIDMGEKVIINIKTFMDGHRPPDRVLPSML